MSDHKTLVNGNRTTYPHTSALNTIVRNWKDFRKFLSIRKFRYVLRIPDNGTIERSKGIFFSPSLRGGLEKRCLVNLYSTFTKCTITARRPDNLAHIHCNAYFLNSLEQFNLKIQLTCRYAPIFPFFWLNVNENMIQSRLRFALPLPVDFMNYSSGTAS